MPRPSDADRFLDILQKDRCPLCFLLNDYAHEHVKSLLDESVTDPVSRDALFRSRGFCRRHAWRAVAQGQGLGMAVIYGSLLEKGLKELKPRPGLFKGKSPEPCPICESEKARDSSALQQFTFAWAESRPLREAFLEKGVLCLLHLEGALARKMDEARRAELYEAGRAALDRLLKELNEFLEKQDYHRSRESMGSERDAWVRAVRMIAGERE
jgi:hypothetical protein